MVEMKTPRKRDIFCESRHKMVISLHDNVLAKVYDFMTPLSKSLELTLMSGLSSIYLEPSCHKEPSYIGFSIT